MTIDERVDNICKWTNLGLRDAVRMALLEAMRDQRHNCAEAVIGLESANHAILICREGEAHRLEPTNCIDKHVAHQAVMNAGNE